jgi:hypothetical protein
VRVLFLDNFVFPSVRVAKYQFVEFMSNVGGILGLMVGCSLLSFIEFGYFIGIRSVSDHFQFKKKKVSPLAQDRSVKSQSRFKIFLTEYLDSSTIHAAPYIAKRNWFEK